MCHCRTLTKYQQHDRMGQRRWRPFFLAAIRFRIACRQRVRCPSGRGGANFQLELTKLDVAAAAADAFLARCDSCAGSCALRCKT